MNITRYSSLCPVLFATLVVGCGDPASGLDLDDAWIDADADVDGEVEPVGEAANTLASGEQHTPFSSSSPECMGPGRPVLVVADDGDCSLPLTTSWTVDNLFATGSPGVSQLSSPVPAHMANYCRYTYIGPAAQTGRAYDDLGDAVMADPDMDVQKAAFDCRAFGAAAPEPLALDVISALHDGMMDSIGALDGAEIQALALEPVQLRLIDTVSQTFGGGYNVIDRHGLRLRGLITDIACGGVSPCSSEIGHLVALPRRPDVGADEVDNPDWNYGGSIGYWSDFSLAIYQAVQDWRAYNAAKTNPSLEHERLILNASIGGAPETASATTAQMLASVDALKMAACYGVVVVAAAGNRSDMACQDTGMLAPAIFETMARPTQAECQALGFVPDWDTTLFPVYAAGPDPLPLVWAVGGVDGHDDPLEIGRADSLPRQVAAGAGGAPSQEYWPLWPTTDVALTGTSVSAAVTSATAKLVWGYDPSLRPDEVMDTIYDGGHNLGLTAVGGYAGDDIHRLSVCGSLEEAGAVLPNCVVGPADPNGDLDGFIAATDAYHAQADLDGELESLVSTSPIDLNPVCDGEVLFPGTKPQPDKPICAICALELDDPEATGTAKESLQMSMTWVGQGYIDTIASGIVYLYDEFSNVTTMSLDAATIASLNADPPASVIKVFVDAPDTKRAILSLTYVSSGVETSPLFVIE